MPPVLAPALLVSRPAIRLVLSLAPAASPAMLPLTVTSPLAAAETSRLSAGATAALLTAIAAVSVAPTLTFGSTMLEDATPSAA